MRELVTAHTADLDATALAAARDLLERAFDGEFSEHDWEHALGGIHALACEDGRLVAHGSVVQRRLLHGGRSLRAGYVEAVAVDRAVRGRGYGAAVMDALERVVRGAYELGALSVTEQGAGFYAARGWVPWRGRTSALTPEGVVRTPADDGAVNVLPVGVALDPAGDITCDWRDGDVW